MTFGVKVWDFEKKDIFILECIMLFVSCRYSLAFRDIVLVAGIISKLEIQITNPIQQICNTYRMHHMWKIRIWNKCNFLGVFQVHIFTLAINFLRWTYFGPTRFIHPWTTLIHVTLRVSDVIDKCNSWLADVTFNRRYAMVTAGERNNQARRIITFLRRLFARFK